mgnify:CR=1 FL=1|jgi:Tfp pilus assembly protein PilN
MINKDLNLFTPYKKHAPKTAGRGGKAVALSALAFTLVVGLCFGGLFFYRTTLENDTASLRSKLSQADVAEAGQRLSQEMRKKDLLTKYYLAVSQASGKFALTRHIDPGLLRALTGVMPQDVTLTSLSVTPSSAVLTCSSGQFISSAVYAQALQQNELFSSVTYESVQRQDSGAYSFSITCVFAEQKEESK